MRQKVLFAICLIIAAVLGASAFAQFAPGEWVVSHRMDKPDRLHYIQTECGIILVRVELESI